MLRWAWRWVREACGWTHQLNSRQRVRSRTAHEAEIERGRTAAPGASGCTVRVAAQNLSSHLSRADSSPPRAYEIEQRQTQEPSH